MRLEKSAPQVVNLAKSARRVLDGFDLAVEQARVVLALDISGSMLPLFRRGSIDTLLERLLGLSLNLDDDGDIDVVLFGKNAHNFGVVTADTYRDLVPTLMRKPGLEAGTMYGKAMEMIRQVVRQGPDWGRVPVFVLFLTDGGTQDVRLSEQQIIQASAEPIFWQFVAIGEYDFGDNTSVKRKKRLPRGFDFLDYLDRMEGRVVDNASFFTVRDPAEPTDSDMYSWMMEEYPDWLRQVVAQGMLRP